MADVSDPETILVLAAYGALGLLLAAATLLGGRRRGTAFAGFVAALNLVIACGCALVFPVFGVRYPSHPSTLLFVCCSVLLAASLNAGLLTLSSARADRLLSNSVAQRLGLVLVGAVVPLGSLEILAQLTTRLGLVSYFVPVEIRLGSKTDDWRLAHIMADDYREPDPLLLWRSIPRYPYSSQRFKGPEIEVPKPAGTFRLIGYGDSNTDGPSLGNAWPAQLQAVLDEQHTSGRRYEVVNAGVGGYSSYQGLMRFREEVDVYQPDLIFISFGWNDAAGAIGRPDQEFASLGLFPIFDPVALYIRRLVLRYRLTLVVRRLLSGGARVEFGAAESPRVDLSAFESNLRGFFATARERHVSPIVLTRPYRERTDALRLSPTWRRDVPRYNEVALRVADEAGVFAIDVEREFEGRPGMFLDECHFTPEGHREMARFVAAALQTRGFLSPR